MEPRIELNATPLIDVLLVLLTMLILAVPLMTHATKISLPGKPRTQPLVPLEYLEIDAAGEVYWNGQLLADDAALNAALARLARQSSRALRIAPERLAPYERVAQVMASGQRAGITRMSIDPVVDR